MPRTDSLNSGPFTPDSGAPPVPEKRPPVAVLTSVVQDLIRAAPRGERQRLWAAWVSLLHEAQEADPDRMPWEEIESVKAITMKAAKQALIQLVGILDKEPAGEPGTRQWALDTLAKLFEKVDDDPAAGDGPSRPTPGRYGLIRCAWPECGVVFAPKHPRARYHDSACRQAAFEARKKARAA